MARERRKHKRASLKLPLDVESFEARGKSFRVKTVNLSAGGFYCKVPFYIPVLTKLKVSLMLPSEDEYEAKDGQVITCESMVVRTIPEKPEPGRQTYEIGCFFSDIEEYDRFLIEKYLAEKALSRP